MHSKTVLSRWSRLVESAESDSFGACPASLAWIERSELRLAFEHPPYSSSPAAVHGATHRSSTRNSAVSVTPNSPSVTIGTNILSTW
jgi:hypothetical protein